MRTTSDQHISSSSSTSAPESAHGILLLEHALRLIHQELVLCGPYLTGAIATEVNRVELLARAEARAGNVVRAVTMLLDVANDLANFRRRKGR